jgi:oxygen-independent coproporphyrinogen-3 oxidase
MDYVYMYPPRQAYHNINREDIDGLIQQSIAKFQEINLYFHIPFCRQLCSFCNLYTIRSTDVDQYKLYVELLKKEFSKYSQIISGKKINTLYLGGGTPSLLSPANIKDLFDFIEKNTTINISKIAEVAIEVSPETVDLNRFSELRHFGINRVNLGFQTLINSELRDIGRSYDANIPFQALSIIHRIGFDNVCIDLIYGLPRQTFDDWKYSVEKVLTFNPETICVYPLTLRPATIFNARGYVETVGPDQFRKYDYAEAKLISAGYKQETHIRYTKKSDGGYKQKANHWALQNILGVGAGARSYLWFCDIRNGYGAKNRNQIYKNYVENVLNSRQTVTDGFIMTEEERIRKAIILNLILLDRRWFKELFRTDVLEIFPEEFSFLKELKLLKIENNFLLLTKKGIRHRDAIVQLFFSEVVRDQIKCYRYAD